MESFKSDLRCVLLANKRGVRLDELPRCFKQLTSNQLYYNRNRFSSLESFLESMPDTCQLTRYGDQVFVTAVPTSNQSDLQQLISRQKTDKFDMGKPKAPATFSNHSGGGQFARHASKGYQNRVHKPYDRPSNQQNSGRPRFDRPEGESAARGRQIEHPARDSKAESSDDSREASRSSSSTRSDPKPAARSGSRNGFRSRSGSRGGMRSKGQFRSAERQDGGLPENLDPNAAAEFNAYKRRSSRSGSTGSLDKKSKFNEEFFKLTLEIKTIDTSVDHKDKLAKFIETYALSEPIYSTTTHQHGDQTVYFAKLQIGLKDFVTFPDCYVCEESAEHAAAKIALDKLNALLCLNCSSDSASESEDELVENILQLLAKEKDDLILSYHLEKRYYEVYRQNLHANWLDMIKSSKCFSVDEIEVGHKSFFSVALARPPARSPGARSPLKQFAVEQPTMQPAEQLIMHPVERPTKQSTEQPAKIRLVDTDELSENVEEWDDEETLFDYDDWEGAEEEMLMNGGVPLAAIEEAGQQSAGMKYQVETEEELGFAPDEETMCTNLDEVAITSEVETSDSGRSRSRSPFSDLHTILELPTELELPRDGDWTVHVLEVTEAGSLQLRLADNYPQLEELSREMHRFYVQEQRGELKKLIKGNVYAAVVGEAVFRVQLLQLLSNGQARCRFLDDGLTEVAYCCNLFEIDRQFLRLPWQAFHARLDGIRPDQLTKFAPLIRLFIELKMLEHQNQLYLVARPTCHEPVTVRLFDTSHPSHDLDVNKLLIDFLSQK